MDIHDIRFECCRPIESDALLILQWRNDPVTLANSFHSEPKTQKKFYEEYLSSYFAFPDLPPLFVILDNQRMAFLRFVPCENPLEIKRRCCEISINIAPEWRRRGIGTSILKNIQQWMALRGYDDLLASIKIHNETSLKAFRAAGFIELEPAFKSIDDMHSVPIYRLIAPLTSRSMLPFNKVYIIAEAGSNWRCGSRDRDLAMAFRLIDVAKDAGADAVKFQVFRAQTIYAPNAGVSHYLSQAGIQQDIHDLFNDLAMPYEMIPLLAEYCQKMHIDFLASVFSPEDFAVIDPYVKMHKIASYEIGHVHLLKAAANSQKPLLLSTGAANDSDISWAVNYFWQCGGLDLVLLQCTACYPAPPSHMNLAALSSLKASYKVEVGLSDHSADPICAAISAVALGACVIEKHFTLSKKLPGPDHQFAITPDELQELVKAVRLCEEMRGSGIKSIQASEWELRNFAQRGLQALRSISQGDILRENSNFAILRPGNNTKGIHPRHLKEIEGKIAIHSISEGQGIQLFDVSEEQNDKNENVSHAIKALFVDLDGTLADSMPLLYQCYRDFMRKFSLQPTWDEFISLVGPSLQEIVTTLKVKYQLPQEVHALHEIYLKMLDDNYLRQVRPAPFAAECLHYAKYQLKMRIALVTSGPRTFAEAFINKHRLASLFDNFYCGEDVIKAKPDSAIYRLALNSMKLQENEVISIEDSSNGVKAAVNAGIFTYWFNPYQQPLFHESTYPHTLIVNSWEVVLSLLKRGGHAN